MFILVLLSHLLFVTIHRPTPPAKVNLTVEVQNVRVRTGAVYVAIYRPAENFTDTKPLEGKKIDATANTVRTTFSVEPGDYAIAVYHDENGNGQMDKRMFGIPKEPYGFSNNFRPKMSAPKFKDCQFAVGADGKVISIRLN